MALNSLAPRAFFHAIRIACLFSMSGSIMAQNDPSIPDPAGEFVRFVTEVEIVSWKIGGAGGTDDLRSDAFQIHGVVGRNTWTLSNQMFDQTNCYSFDGTKIVERKSKSRKGDWWTGSIASQDGNPSRTVRVADHLDMVSRIAWLAFCSGPTLNNPNHKLYPPWDFWKQYVTPPFAEKVERFEDDLGLPKKLVLSSGEQPVLDYRAYATTNVSGWLFPAKFFLLQYLPDGTGSWSLVSLVQGKLVSITPAADPLAATETQALTPSSVIRFIPASPGRVRIDGTSDVHDWSLETTNVIGFLELNKSILATPLPELHENELQARAEFYIPVRHFSSGFSAPMFSEKADQAVLHHALKTKDNPNIVYRLQRLDAAKEQPGAPDFVLQSTGELVAGGVTNLVSFPVRLSRKDDAVTLSGSTSVRLTNFGIEPPSARGKEWVVKVGNSVECSFDLVLKQSPPIEPLNDR